MPKPTQGELHKQLNAIKRDEFPWMLEVTKNAPKMAIIQLGVAFKRFFKRQASYPKFKKKGIHDSFSITNDQFALNDALNRIRIPIADMGFYEFKRQLEYKVQMRGVLIVVANSWYPSSVTRNSALNQTLIIVN